MGFKLIVYPTASLPGLRDVRLLGGIGPHARLRYRINPLPTAYPYSVLSARKARRFYSALPQGTINHRKIHLPHQDPANNVLEVISSPLCFNTFESLASHKIPSIRHVNPTRAIRAWFSQWVSKAPIANKVCTGLNSTRTVDI